jgi:hypothetical protein
MSFVRRRRRYILKLTYAVKMVHTKLFLLEKLIIAQLVKKFYAFDGNQRFNTCSQQPTTGTFLNLQSTPSNCFFKTNFKMAQKSLG